MKPKSKKIIGTVLCTLLVFNSVSLFAHATDTQYGTVDPSENIIYDNWDDYEEFIHEELRLLPTDKYIQLMQRLILTEDGKIRESDENLAEICSFYEEIESETAQINSLPTSVDLSSDFPSPGNQGSQNSCTSWAVAYAAKSGFETKERSWTVGTVNHNFSPSYIYNQVNSGDTGSSILENLTIVENEGVCPISYFPYNESDYTTQPTAIQEAAASIYKGSTKHPVFGLSDIKEKINDGRAVIISIYVYPDFDNLNATTNQIYDSTTGTSRGSHAIALIGYDNNKGTSGAFKILNSWGTDWGSNGYGWISYDLVQSSVAMRNPETGYCLYGNADTTYTIGDIDCDGSISVTDANMALQYSVHNATPTALQFVLADADGNADVSVADSREILRVATGLETKCSVYN